uniref:Uncharacterized protein n=1 Tax=Pararge aegeria TaxID=116150 RepID=S4NVR6_9NEOP
MNRKNTGKLRTLLCIFMKCVNSKKVSSFHINILFFGIFAHATITSRVLLLETSISAYLYHWFCAFSRDLK